MPDSYFTLVAAITTTISTIITPPPTASFVEEMMCGLVTDRKFVSWCQSHSKKVVVVYTSCQRNNNSSSGPVWGSVLSSTCSVFGV